MSTLTVNSISDIHSVSLSEGGDVPILVISLKQDADLQKFRDLILKNHAQVTFFKWKIQEERVFSTVVIGDKKTRQVAKRLEKHFF